MPAGRPWWLNPWRWAFRALLTAVASILALALAFLAAFYVGLVFRLAHAGWKLAWW